MTLSKSLFATAFLVTAMVASSASAADSVDVPGHPRINEVNNRIDNQQERIANQEATGKITAQQAAKDDQRLTNESQQLSADEAKNGGHITKQEQRRLNKKLNTNNKIDRHQEKKDAAQQ